MSESILDSYLEKTLPKMLVRWSQQFYLSRMGEIPLKNKSVLPILDQSFLPSEEDLVFAYLCGQEGEFFNGDFGELELSGSNIITLPEPCYHVGQMVADTRYNQYVSCRETGDSAVNVFGKETVFDTYGFVASSFAEVVSYNANIKHGIDFVLRNAGDYVFSNIQFVDVEVPSDVDLVSEEFYWMGTLRGLIHEKSEIRSVAVRNLMVCAEQMDFCLDVFKQAIFTNIKKRNQGCSDFLSLILISKDDKETKINFVTDLIRMFDERQAKSDIDKVRVNSVHEQGLMGSMLQEEYAPLNATDRDDLVTVLEMIKSDDRDISKVSEELASGLQGIKEAAKEALAKQAN